MALLKFGERTILQIMSGEETIEREALVARRREQRALREKMGDASDNP